jgi:hypothetical protein
VRPFVLQSASQFRSVPPPALTSARYTAAYAEVTRLGGDGVTTPTERTAEQTTTGVFWAYDGTPNLGAPPRLYNQIAILVANRRNTGNDSLVHLARLLALVNTAMADGGIACWEAKYFYKVWRPITAIRQADTDDNPDTADPAFTARRSASNIDPGVNHAAFSAYPSGHDVRAAYSSSCAATTTQRPFQLRLRRPNGETDNQGNASRSHATSGVL